MARPATRGVIRRSSHQWSAPSMLGCGKVSTAGERTHCTQCPASRVLRRCGEFLPLRLHVRRDLCLRAFGKSRRSALDGSDRLPIGHTPTPNRTHRIEAADRDPVSNWSGDFQIRINIFVGGLSCSPVAEPQPSVPIPGSTFLNAGSSGAVGRSGSLCRRSTTAASWRMASQPWLYSSCTGAASSPVARGTARR